MVDEVSFFPPFLLSSSCKREVIGIDISSTVICRAKMSLQPLAFN